MLPVFSVILEYRKDGRNTSDRPACTLAISRQTRWPALSPFQGKPKHIHLYSFEPYWLQLITEHAFLVDQAQKVNLGFE